MKTVILMHGRGGSAAEMESFAHSYLPNATYIAIQAEGGSWYPARFMEPIEHNQEGIDAAFRLIEHVVGSRAWSDVVLLGFSQGACLAAHYALTHPRRYGGIIAFSGGAIGQQLPDGSGSLERTPVLIGCSTNDPHIPLSRVHETIGLFESMDAKVISEIYAGGSHSISIDEIDQARRIIS